MAFTQTQLDSLEAAIARGVRRVTYDGQTTEYSTTAEMIQLREMMRRQLGLADSGRRYATYNKGT